MSIVQSLTLPINRLLILAALSSAFFFALQVTLAAGLQYTTTYFQSQLIIAIGLVGILVGGLLASKTKTERLRAFIMAAVGTYCVLPGLGLVALLLSFAYPFLSIAILCGTFVPLGYVLTGLYRMASPWHLYAAELLGAVVGLGAVVVLIPLLRVENTLFLLCSLALVSCGMFWFRWHTASRVFWLASVVLIVTLTSSNITSRHVDLAIHTICDVERAEVFSGNKVICLDETGFSFQLLHSFGSLVDRIDVVRPGQGEHFSVMYSGTRNDLIQPFKPEEYVQDARIPGGVLDNPKTLIIGAGAEGVAKVAKGIGAEDITVVEINPAVLKIWDDGLPYRGFAQAPFDDVEIIVSDGRTFVHQTDEKYDIITLMNTHRTLNLVHFGQPDFLHTQEAIQQYIELLTDDGFISLEEVSFNQTADVEIARRITTIQAALAASGAENPNNHLIVYQWVGAVRDGQYANFYDTIYTQIIIKKQAWQVEELADFKAWAVQSNDTTGFLRPTNMAFYRSVWYPDTGVNEVVAQESSIADPFIERGSYSVLTDNQPFVSFISQLDREFLQISALVFTTICALLVMSWLAHRTITTLLWPSYFLLIGLTYMGIEIFLLFWLQKYLGSVLVSFVVTIGGLFVASALASLYIWRAHTVTAARLLIPLLIATGASIFLYTMPVAAYGNASTLLISVSIVSIIGIALAPFFPYAITAAQENFRQQIPLLVGINTLGLAAGVPLSIFIAAMFGFNMLLAAAFIGYVCAITILVWLK